MVKITLPTRLYILLSVLTVPLVKLWPSGAGNVLKEVIINVNEI